MTNDMKASLLFMIHFYDRPLTTNSNGNDLALDELIKDIKELKIMLAWLAKNDHS